jgi:hypothetical protein
VLADLERPDKDGKTGDISNPAEWENKVKESLDAIMKYKANWKDFPEETFKGGNSIFRTEEGYRMYQEWLKFWEIQEETVS